MNICLSVYDLFSTSFNVFIEKQSTSAANPPTKAAAEEEGEMDEEEYKLLGSNKLVRQLILQV